MGAVDHELGEFGFGLKGERVWDVGGVPAWQIRTPVFRKVQLAIDEAMAGSGDVGEEDADLAVFHAPGEPTILGPDARRVAAALGKAAFIDDQDREGRLAGWLLLRGLWRAQAGRDQGAQVVAHRVLVPDGCREQALHAIRAGLPGLFSDLPAIFSGHVTQDRLQVAQGMLVDFGACEVRTQPRVQLAQVVVPPADFTKRWPDWRRCGMLRGLHAVLAFDEGYQSEGLQLLAWHIEASNARSGPGVQGHFPGRFQGEFLPF